MADAIRAAHAGQPTLTTEALAALVELSHTSPLPGADLSERAGDSGVAGGRHVKRPDAQIQIVSVASPREQEVLALLVEGMLNAQIAQRLIVRHALAVKFHVSSILSKLGAANRTEAAALARKHGLAAKPD